MLINSTNILSIVALSFGSLIFLIQILRNYKVATYIFIASLPLEMIVSDTFFTIPKILGLVAALTFLLSAMKNKRKIKFDRTTAVLFLFLLWGSVSYFWSAYPQISAARIVTVVLIIIMYILIINQVDSYQSISALMKYSIIGGALLGFSGLYEIFQSETAIERIAGASGNANIYFTMAIFMIPAIYWNLVNSRNIFWKAFSIGVLGVLLVTSVYTQSRGGLISLGIFLVSYLLFSRNKLSAVSIVLVVALAILLIAPDSFWERFVDQGYSTSYDRISTLWPAGIKVFEQQMFSGYGLGVSDRILPNYLPVYMSRASVHNSLLALMIDLGLPGAFLYLLAVALPTAQILQRCCLPRETLRTDMEKFGVIVFSVLLAYLASWFKSGGFEYYKYLWVLVGLEACIIFLLKTQESQYMPEINKR